MLERIAKLEQRMDSVIPTLATKADFHKAISEMKVWVIGTLLTILMVTAMFGMFLLASVRSDERPPTRADQVKHTGT